MPSQHSLFPPSSMSRLINCPASWSRSRAVELTISSDRETPVMREGTIAHAVLEYLLKGTGRKRWKKEVQDEATEEMLTAVKVAKREISRLRQRWPGEEFIESRVTLDYWGMPEVWGTCDYFRRNSYENLVVLDYKHGSGVWVDADSDQLRTYAAGAAGADLHNYEAVELIIVQPRCYETKEKVRRHFMSSQDLEMWIYNTLAPALENAQSENPVANPGESQCRWCPANAVCPEYSEEALAVVGTTFAELTDLESLRVTGEQLKPVNLAVLLEKLPLLKNWIKAVEKYAYDTLAAGSDIPGYKLVSGRNSRSWADPDAAVKFLHACGLDDSTLFTEPALITPAKAEKLVPPDLRSDLAQWISVSEGKPTIAQESDRRPKLDIALNAFKEIENV